MQACELTYTPLNVLHQSVDSIFVQAGSRVRVHQLINTPRDGGALRLQRIEIAR